MSRLRNFAPRAADDIDRAVGWHLDHGAAEQAERLLDAVLGAGELLAARPLLGRRRPELLPDPFRFWSLPHFGLLIVYDPSTDPVTVLRVVNTSQDLGPLLADLGGSPEPDAGG